MKLISISIMFSLMVIQVLILLVSYFKEKILMFYVSWILLSSLFLFNSWSLFYIYLYFELSLLPMLLLILGWGYNQEKLLASSYLLVYTVISSLPLLYYIVIPAKIMYLSNFYFHILLIPFLVKTPMVLFHLWLPKAHLEASTLGSMILAAIMLKLGGYGIFYLINYNTNNQFVFWAVVMFGMFYMGYLTIIQSDGKSLIAYSSVSHMNMSLLLLFLLLPMSLEGFILSNLFHAIISSMLFFMMGYMYMYTSSRMIYNIKGVLFSINLMLVFFVVGGNSGLMIPFVSEALHLSSLFMNSPMLLMLLSMVVMLVGLFSIHLYLSFGISGKRGVSMNIMSLFSMFYILNMLSLGYLML